MPKSVIPKPRQPSPLDVQVGERLRKRRLQVGMSQEQLAGILGVSFQQVQKYERGANRIPTARLVDVSRALDISLNYFFNVLRDTPEIAQPELERDIISVFQSLPSDAHRRTALTMVRSLQKPTKE